MMEKLGTCGLISWLIGLVAAVIAYLVSVEDTTWLPALLIAIAVGAFIGLVLSHLFCGGVHAAGHESAGHDAAHGPGHGQGHAAIAEDALAAADAGDLDAGAAAAGIDPARAAAEKAKLDAAVAAEQAEAEAKAAEAKAAAKAAEAATPDFDGDGALEGENEGTKPATLAAARGGKADNLKEIKGVGPKLEAMLNGMGFWHFDQIAGWSADEVAWVNANLTGFKGRVSRDNWVEQARILAAGGETEFSKRVDKGEVY